MKPVNLIPARRLIARQRLRHVRRCVVICSSWAFVVAGVCALGQGLVPSSAAGSDAPGIEGSPASLPARLERAAKDVDAAQLNAAAAREDLANAQATLRATRAIADQPDWSTLLALLGRATGDDVMLRTFELQPQASASPGTGATATKVGGRIAGSSSLQSAKAGAFVLSTSGLARSQLAVTQFVLRLEQIGLFSKVTLLDTSREPFRDAEATSFRVECVIDINPPAAATGAPAKPSKLQPGDKR
jgi:hypothetical protein